MTAKEIEAWKTVVRKMTASGKPTQKWVAEEVGYTAVHLSKVLAGDNPLTDEFACKVCEVLGIPRPPSLGGYDGDTSTQPLDLEIMVQMKILMSLLDQRLSYSSSASERTPQNLASNLPQVSPAVHTPEMIAPPGRSSSTDE